MTDKDQTSPSAGAKPRDCLYVEREDGTWSHSLFCPIHPTRGGMSLGDEGWPTGPDCAIFTYATGESGLDPYAPTWAGGQGKTDPVGE